MSASTLPERRQTSFSWLLPLLRRLVRPSPSTATTALGAYGALAAHEVRRP